MGTKKLDLSKLKDGNPWKRSVVLASINRNDLLNTDVLSEVVRLLSDKAQFQEPERLAGSADQALSALLRRSENRNTRWNALIPTGSEKQANPIYEVGVVAMRVLINAEPVPVKVDKDVVDILAKHSIADTKDPHLARHFLDQHLHRFEWYDPTEAARRYSVAVLSSAASIPACLETICRDGKRDEEQGLLNDIAAAAAKRDPPAWDALHAVAKGAKKDVGTMAFLDALEANPKALKTPILPSLLSTTTKQGCLERGLALLKKMEDNGEHLAAGYISLVDPDGGERFKAYLESSKKKDQAELARLLTIARDAHWPLSFPAAELFARCDRDKAIKWIVEWAEVPEDLKMEALQRMAQVHKAPRQAYEPLFEIAKTGAMKTNRDLSVQLWKSVKDALTATDDWRIRNPLNIDNHPLVALGHPSIRPMGYEDALLEYVLNSIIKASIYFACVGGRANIPERQKKRIERAIEAEVKAVETLWEKQKNNTSLPPRATAVFLLKEKWAGMLVACREMGLTNLAQRVEALSRISAAQFQR